MSLELLSSTILWNIMSPHFGAGQDSFPAKSALQSRENADPRAGGNSEMTDVTSREASEVGEKGKCEHELGLDNLNGSNLVMKALVSKTCLTIVHGLRYKYFLSMHQELLQLRSTIYL
jgi:hypothetical protein